MLREAVRLEVRTNAGITVEVAGAAPGALFDDGIDSV